MGRPLFSTQPAVRVEPEPESAYPQYETWTYLKPFDPDADEFFDSDDAVFEAFIDPAHTLPHAPTAEQVITYLSEVNSESSSSSGRGSPTTPGPEASPPPLEDPEQRPAEGAGVWRLIPVEDRRGIDASPVAARAPLDLPAPEPPQERTYEPGEMVSAYTNMYTIVSPRRTPPPAPRMAPRQPTFIRYPSEDRSRTPPLSMPMWGPPPLTPTPPRPTTPPGYAESPAIGSPSPPPSVTPRIYSWSALNPALINPPPSPLSLAHTARAARRPIAHAAPAPQLVPVSRLLG